MTMRPAHELAIRVNCMPELGGTYTDGYVRALRDVAIVVNGLTLGVRSADLASALENQANTIRRVLRGDEVAS